MIINRLHPIYLPFFGLILLAIDQNRSRVSACLRELHLPKDHQVEAFLTRESLDAEEHLLVRVFHVSLDQRSATDENCISQEVDCSFEALLDADGASFVDQTVFKSKEDALSEFFCKQKYFFSQKFSEKSLKNLM